MANKKRLFRTNEEFEADRERRRQKAMHEPFLNVDRLNHVLGVILSKITENPDLYWRDIDEGLDLYNEIHVQLGELRNNQYVFLFGELLEGLFFDLSVCASGLAEKNKKRMLRQRLERAGLTPEQLDEVFREDPPDPPRSA